MSCGGGIDALCDDAIAEILVRLPSESVLRCRAVCKSWRRIATGRSFLAAHAARSPREMVTLTQSWTVSAVLLSPGLDAADDGARRRYLCDPSLYNGNGEFRGSSRLVASLDGLLVLKQRPGLYVVCNPTTRQWTNLPVLAPQPCAAAFSCGFYHHRPSGEYRLLCHAEEHREPGSSDWKDYYYTLSAGSTLPRRLARAPADRPYKTDFYQLPVAHRGTLYWLCLHPEARRTGKMLAFRTDSETFRLVSRPPTGDAPPPTGEAAPASALLELHGALCAVARRYDGRYGLLLDVWVLQDYEAGRWTLRHRVAVPPPRRLDGRGLLANWAISAGGSSIVVGEGGCSGVIRLCDLEEKRVKELKFHSTPTSLMFSESLVSHDFFQAPRCPELAPLKFPD